MSITRRLFLRKTGAAAVAASVAAPPVAGAEIIEESAEKRAERAWSEFCKAVDELTQDYGDCRMQIYGSHRHGQEQPCFRFDLLRARREHVGHGLFGTFETTPMAAHFLQGQWYWEAQP